MTEEGIKTVAAWRRRLARPLFLLGVIGGAVIFLPRMMRHEVRLIPRADHVACAQWASVMLEQDGELLRRFKVPASGARTFSEHTVHLAEGVYNAVSLLECNDGGVTAGERQSIVVDGESTVFLRIQNRCRCDAPAD